MGPSPLPHSTQAPCWCCVCSVLGRKEDSPLFSLQPHEVIAEEWDSGGLAKVLRVTS